MDGVRKELVGDRGTFTTAALLLAAVVACTGNTAQASSDSLYVDSLTRARQDSLNRAQPGYVVDSIFPIAEEIRRFSAGLPRPTALEGGAETRSALVRRFVQALQGHDTVGLRALLVTRSEFAHLMFPDSPLAREPFKTKPGLIWMQLEAESARGMTRLLERVGGATHRLSSLRCGAKPERQGPNTYWRNCSMLISGPERVRRSRLFGQILERDGRAKFVAYTTDF